jgi:hypothetical protein
LKGLQGLNVMQTAITDAGLVHLKEMKGLQTLSLVLTKTTVAGRDDLRKALPNTHITP